MTAPDSTVFLVDDDPAVRESLALVLETAGFAVETFASAEAFLQAYSAGRSGCLVLDVNMPGMSGLELQRTLAARNLPIAIIFLTGHGDIPMSVQAVKAGAVDFLPKPFGGRDLVERVREAVAFDAENRKSQTRICAISDRFERLTPREREVMEAVVKGLSSKEVARELGLSYRTVEIHRARVMDKMEAGSLPELVTLAVVCGVIDPAH